MKTTRKDGKPTIYGLACGYGLQVNEGDASKSLFECESHNCIDVKAFSQSGERVWEQFFFWDYPTRSDCYKAALHFFGRLKWNS